MTFSAPTQRLARVTLVLAISLYGAPSTRAETLAPLQKSVQDGAESARKKCYGLIHHDTYEFSYCVLDQVRAEKNASAKRLGYEYFAWVGNLNSWRMSMPGSEESAYEFLRRYRITQAKLRISDADLCRTVAGDCVARLAKQQEMERDAKRLANQTPKLPRREDLDH